MIDIGQTCADRVLIHTWNGYKVNVVDADALAVFIQIAIHQIHQRAANAFNCRNLQFHRACARSHRLGAHRHEFGKSIGCIFDAKRHRIGAGAMLIGKGFGLAARLGVQNKIDLSLAVQSHIFTAVARNGGKTERFKQRAQFFRLIGSVFNEFKTIRTDGVVPSMHVCLQFRFNKGLCVNCTDNIVQFLRIYRSIKTICAIKSA